MNDNFHVTVISTIDEFAGCETPWNDLAGERIFHRWQWMYSWWESFQDRGQLAVIVVTDGQGRWMGCAPWYKSKSAPRGRVIRTLGSGAACSDYVGIRMRDGCYQAVANQMAKCIQENRQLFGDVDLFSLEGHTGHDREILEFSKCMNQLGFRTRETEFAGTWRSQLPDTWPEYSQGLHKSFRRKTKKALKRLDETEFEATVFTSPKEIEKNLADICRTASATPTKLGPTRMLCR